MKRIASLLLVLALLCAGFCCAEAKSAKVTALDTISVINFMMLKLMEFEVFDTVGTVEDGSLYRFTGEKSNVELLVSINPESGKAELCSFVSEDTYDLNMAMMCSCCLAAHEYLNGDDPAAESTWHSDMMTLYDWYDGFRDEALNALKTGRPFSAAYTANKYFHIEVEIAPGEDGAYVATINHYLYPAAA